MAGYILIGCVVLLIILLFIKDKKTDKLNKQ